MPLSSRHRSTHRAIFEQPTRADVHWDDFALLVSALGGDVQMGAGSRRRLTLNGVRAVLHKPHPQPEMKKSSVDSAKEFLINAGHKFKEESPTPRTGGDTT